MAGTFGRVIQDKELQKIGVLNELLGVGLATAIGFCYGVIITSFTDRYGDGDWPTYEMTSRYNFIYCIMKIKAYSSKSLFYCIIYEEAIFASILFIAEVKLEPYGSVV